MCTAIAYKGNDLIYGFNLDIDPAVWKHDVYITKNYFSIGITLGNTTYLTHGVTNNGVFANLPYMNGPAESYSIDIKKHRIDLIVDKIIRGKMNISEVIDILNSEKQCIASPKNLSFHSLLGDTNGNILLVEPGIGYKEIENNYAVITNFPVLKEGNYSEIYFGKDRYAKAKYELENITNNLEIDKALDILYSVRQEGKWATRVTFVYSQNENSVFYYLNNQRNNIQIHKFK